MTSSDMLRVGFVGAGNHATNAIYPALRYAPIRLVAIADLDEDRARRNAAWFGAREVYGDHRTLLERADIDAVVVVGQPPMHASVGLDVLAAGRHLFVEKPPGATLADTLALQAAAHDSGCSVMVGFMKRFARAYVRARAIADSPEFGAPRVLRFDYSHWQAGDLRSHLLFMSVHAFDLARAFLGPVVAGAGTRRELGDARALTLELDHASGALSQLHLSSCAPRVQESLDLYGDSTMVRVDNLTELRSYRRAPGIADAVDTDESMSSVWHPDFAVPLAGNDSLVLQGYAGQMRHFAEQLLAGQPIVGDITDGVAAMELVEAVAAAPAGHFHLQL